MQTLKSIVAGAAIVTVFSLSAAEAQTWKGPYISGHFGKATQKDDSSETLVFDKNLDGNFSDTVTTAAGANAFSPGFCGGGANGSTPDRGCIADDDGADYGGRIGYDWQMGALVFGLVGEYSKHKIEDHVAGFSTTPAFYTMTRQIDHSTALRARIGFGAERFLIYGTGGGVIGDLEYDFGSSNTVNTFVRDEDAMIYGFQAGGGIEFKLMKRVSLSGEYLFTSLDDRDKFTVRAQGPAPATNPFILTNAAGTDIRRTDKFKFQSLRASLNFRF